MAKKDKPEKPSKGKKIKNHVRKTYDTTDHTDPSNPVEKKGIIYSDDTMTHIIFATQDKLEPKLRELMSDLEPEEIDAKIKELTD